MICGNNHTFCINKEENVLAFGYSYIGVHGHEGTVVFSKKIPSLTHIKSIVSMSYHSVCLDNDGNVYTFGSNYAGQLGIGVDKEELQFTHIPQKVNLPPCTQISCGNFFSICLSSDGVLYSFGDNRDGQLCLGNYQDSYNSPQKVTSLTDVEFVECGGFHVFCKTFNNEIFSWGDNRCGQLGLGNTDNQNTSVKLSLPNEDVIDIKCGLSHSLILTSKKEVLSCGSNEFGQFGRMAIDYTTFQKVLSLQEITRIECGNNHSLCIDANDNLYVFGWNNEGQLGLDDYDDRYTPMKHPSLSNIIDISKGGNHTFVKTSKNEIYSFGNNEFAQLGIKTEHDNQSAPIRVFEDNEDIWFSNINKSKAKSARSILPRPSNEDDNSPPEKKQKTK